jgi:hypothetical protein
MVLPEAVIEAVCKYWGIQSDFAERLGVEELVDDWIVWRLEDTDKAGGLRLVVPKRGANPFEIPSNASASDQQGVSWEYEIIVSPQSSASQEAATILEKYVGMSRVEAYKLLKSPPATSPAYFIAAPLALIRELSDHNVSVRLVRPGGNGEYQSKPEVG